MSRVMDGDTYDWIQQLGIRCFNANSCRIVKNNIKHRSRTIMTMKDDIGRWVNLKVRKSQCHEDLNSMAIDHVIAIDYYLQQTSV